MPDLDLDVALGFHLVAKGCLQVPSGGDLVVEEANWEVEGVIEGWSDRVFEGRRGLHHVVPTSAQALSTNLC